MSARKAAEMIGRASGEITGRELQEFIFLHELGHASDFLRNFAMDPDIGEANAVQAWKDASAQEMEGLPVPHVFPNELSEAATKYGDVTMLADEFPEAKVAMDRLGFTSLQQLLDAQETAYRNLRKESFADKFAADLFKARNNKKAQ